MQEISFDDCKKLQLDILIGVAEFCERHNIRYSLAYGTLIGAIRHKGYIPWDDDIDIIMPRLDYDKFVASFQHPKYKLLGGASLSNHLHHVVTDMQTTLVFEKSLNDNHYYKGGLWVDVFPIDKVPDDKDEYKKLKKRISTLCTLHRYGEFPDQLIAASVKPSKKRMKKMFSWVMKPFVKPLGCLINRTVHNYNDKQTKTGADLSLWYLGWPSFPIVWLDDYVDVEFENHKFKAIKEYDSFLRAIYGDYMQYPPKEDQVPKHAYKAYYRNQD